MDKNLKTRTILILAVNIILIFMEFMGLVLMVELYKSYNLHP